MTGKKSGGVQLWVGLAKLAPKVGNESLEGAAGAWVHVVGSAGSQDEFCRDLDSALEEFRFVLLELKDIWHADRIDDLSTASDEIGELASRVAEDGYLRFGTFFTYSPPH